MKTKNIFRMLLVAAALLLGANNVKAGETKSYISGDFPYTFTDSRSISWTSPFGEIEVGDFIEVAGTDGNGTTGFYIMGEYDYIWTYQLFDYNSNGIFKGNTIRIKVNYDNITNLQKSCGFGGQNITVNSIAIVKQTGYNINISQPENGTISVDKKKADEGEIVTLEANPNDDYKLISFVVTNDATNGTIEVVDDQFTMPNSSVTVTGTFGLIDYNITEATEIWKSKAGKAVDWWDNRLELSSKYFEYANTSWKIRVYGSGTQVGIKIQDSSNWQDLQGGATNGDGYVEFSINNDDLTRLKNLLKFAIVGNAYTVTSVSIIPAGDIVVKQNSSITFSGNGNESVVFGNTFTAPTVTTTPADATLTYESSDFKVAKIINGNVVPVGAGNTVIKAIYAGNDTYKGTEATYNLTVSAPTTEGAVWQGAVWLDWNNQANTNIQTNDAFKAIKSGDQLLIYGKKGPDHETNFNLELFQLNSDWSWGSKFIELNQSNFSNGCFTINVDNNNVTSIQNGLKDNVGGYCAGVNGLNFTITAIKVVAAQPEQTINGNWTATSTVPEAGATIKDDDALTISTVYATTGGNDSRQIHGVAFNQFIKVRTEAAPSADNVTGTQRTDCTPITITAKRNTTVVFYYRRQADNSSTDWSFTSNDSKDLKLVDQSAPTTVINGTLSVNNAIYNDGVYGYVAKTYTLEAGKTYTVWATGTTIQLYGIYYSTNASNVQVNTTYKITYYNGENVYCAIWLPSGATIPSLDTDPSLEGYTFDGWKDGSGNNLPSTMPANDLTVYAQFSQNGQQEPSYIEVNMGNYEFRTYVTTTNIDFSQSIGIKGYYASSANNSEVELTEITGIVASNVPLLLRKVSGATDYKLRVADTEGTVPSPNLLVAGSNANVSGSNCYVLTFHNGLVFAEVNNESAYVDSEHAYLRVSGSNARGHLKVRFNDNGTAGIKDIESGEQGAKVVYDLRGQRVERPTKGIYIINGKKTVIK